MLGEDHEARAAEIAQEYLRDVIASVGADLNFVIDLIGGNDRRRRDPRAYIIHHKTLGADFLAWCERDSKELGIAGCPDIEMIRSSPVYVNGTLAVQERAINRVKAAQKHRYVLHDEGFLAEESLVIQRKLQRAVEEG